MCDITGSVVGGSELFYDGDEDDAVRVVDADQEGVDQQGAHADAPRPARVQLCQLGGDHVCTFLSFL